VYKGGRHGSLCVRAATLIAACLLAGGVLLAAEPGQYVRKATWQETMLASRQAMMRERGEEGHGAEPFVSPVMRGRDAARHVRVRVAGWRELWLVATGVPNNHHCYSDWGEARLVAKDGSVAWLDALKPASFWRSYGHLRLNEGHSGGPLQVGERRFKRGLGVHADSRICYRLDGRYEWFEAWIGIDIAKGARGLGHTRFEVRPRPADGRADLAELWRRLEADFPAARREMRWERQDRIWDGGWATWTSTSTATACFQCVPCNGSHVAVLYRMDADGSNVRQLCFEQDHDFNPAALPNGRVLYLRWEYSDLPHANSRILFSMNPDGTGQMAVYGRNSYWPNSLFGARPIPGRSDRFVGIVAGHHGSYREGELVVFDASRGRGEADGVVRRIPGRGGCAVEALAPPPPIAENGRVGGMAGWARELTEG